MIDSRAQRRSAPALLALAVVLFASVWPAMKFGLAESSPVWFAAGRAGLSALAGFALVTALGRLRLPDGRDWPIVLSIGGLQLGAYFGVCLIALEQLPAGRSALLGYTTPMWILPLAWPILGERPRRRDVFGLVVGLAGIGVLVGPSMLDPALLTGHALMLIGSGFWAVSILHTRGHRWHLTPLELLPWQMLVATLLLIPFALWREPQGGIALSPGALLPLAYVGLLAGPIASWASLSAARALPASMTSLGFLMTPVLGVAISALWLDEAIGPDMLIGGALILVGVGVTLRR